MTMTHSNGHGYYDSQRSGQETGGFRQGEEDFGGHISFVYANEKRFSEFHSVFRSVPDSEKLIEGNWAMFSCTIGKKQP